MHLWKKKREEKQENKKEKIKINERLNK